MPTVQLPDGRWLTDSNKMIEWFEGGYPENPVVPNDPVQAFVCCLREDWADEWCGVLQCTIDGFMRKVLDLRRVIWLAKC